jgi:hypothetical protein
MKRAKQNRRARSGPVGEAELEILYLIGKGIVRIGGALGGRWKRRRKTRRESSSASENQSTREPRRPRIAPTHRAPCA